MFYIVYNIIDNTNTIVKVLKDTSNSSAKKSDALATVLDMTTSLVTSNCELILIKYTSIARKMYEMTKKPKDLVIAKEAEAALFEHRQRQASLNKAAAITEINNKAKNDNL